MKTRVLALLFAALASSGLAQSSSVPTLISYSGKVVDASGNPITGQRLMVFRIWDGPTDSGAANRKWSEQQTVVLSAGEFSVRIGLEVGDVIVGNIGTPERFAYNVIGDSVNLASRLENLCKYYGTSIIGTDELKRSTGTAFEWRHLDRVAVV